MVLMNDMEYQERMNQVIQHYDTVRKCGDGLNPDSIGWYHKEWIPIRFKSFMKLRTSNNILDFGCGIGLLYEYMKVNNIDTSEYYGCDINPRFLRYCKDVIGDNHIFDNFPYGEHFDNVFGIGAICDWTYKNDTTEHVLKQCWDVTNKVMAFSFNSTIVKRRTGKGYFPSVRWLLDIASNMSDYYELIITPLEYEMILVVYRDDENE